MKNIIRVQKDKENPYVMINKIFLNENKMSLKAKGLFAYLLSLPDDWKIYVSDLTKRHKDGKESILSSIKELIKFGYMTRNKVRNEKGQYIGYSYLVHEKPVSNSDSSRNGFSVSGKTVSGKPATTNKEFKLKNNLTNKSSSRKNDDDDHKSYGIKLTKEELEYLKQYNIKFKFKYGSNLESKYLEKIYIEKRKDKLEFYFENYQKFLDSATKDIEDISRFFIYVVTLEKEIPVKYKSNNKPAQALNYEQREYDDEFFDNLYDNI